MNSNVLTAEPVVLLYADLDATRVQQQVVPLLNDRLAAGAVAYKEQVFDPELPLTLNPGSRLICYLSDEHLRELVLQIRSQPYTLALLPHPEMKHARYGFGIAGKMEDAMSDALLNSAIEADLLLCNTVPVFNSVVVGDVLTLTPGEALAEPLTHRIKRFFRLVKGIGDVTFNAFKITTYKEKIVDTAALGIVVVEHGRSSVLSRRLVADSSVNDGMLHALVLAPRSVFEMLRFLFASLFLRDYWNHNSPSFVGHIKSRSLSISSPKQISYTHDGLIEKSNTLQLQVEPRVIQLAPGRYLGLEEAETESKEAVRTRALPAGKAKTELVTYPLPWIHHAATDEFKELFMSLRESAKASPSYLTLMVLATLLAVFGLFANSTPVIIGAMILAPLMGPIISMALGTLRQDAGLMLVSSRSIAVGTGLAMGCAMVATWFIPLTTINSEIAARISPTLLDLGVAVISGIAGAYAHARAEVAKSLAGVAIAVALVPPLAVAGIGLGWLDLAVFWGAFLLFLTNLVGIVLAAVVTFMFLGYSPFHRAKRGLALTLILAAILCIPLAISFSHMVAEHRIVQQLDGIMLDEVKLRDVSVRPGTPLRISVTLVSGSAVDNATMDRVKQRIEQKLQQPVELEIGVKIIR
ncbi:TIGR00341 family protein [Arsukibacterium indicum]|uniref:TIGR00341 family protein n=1 Tax=Arsukibacterium indicum TaxID=2848612 RepID=A0ABS6ML74_9GAMM|nr:TIGR00341 family protein [Arsukibacterium indicum]MBV2129573.1 TIGR00341 family protein [Arsukibacterium indicum]